VTTIPLTVAPPDVGAGVFGAAAGVDGETGDAMVLPFEHAADIATTAVKSTMGLTRNLRITLSPVTPCVFGPPRLVESGHGDPTA
jgi:hypothetical protein